MTRPPLRAPFSRPSTRPRARFRPHAVGLEERSLLSTAAGPWATPDTVAASSAVLLRFNAGTPDARQAAALAAVGGRVVASYPAGPSVVQLAPWEDRDAALAALQADPDIAYAVPDATVHADVAVKPNDPGYFAQWGMPFIDAPDAWGLTTGKPTTVVAVIDTGIDLRNPEFTGRLWVNTAASTARRTVYGWNFLGNNGVPQDDNGHGTHVSGILAAAGNNAVGVAGVAWNVRIMPLKTLNANGDGSTDTSVAAVYFAAQNGAKVINASWGGDEFSPAMRDALNYANARGAVFVTAAGNDGLNNDVSPSYPASYRSPNELVVAAVDPSGNLAGYSDYGPTTVDIAAPGTNIFSTIPGGYASYSGTSMATPFVSGVVALLAGVHPEYSAAQLVATVRATARPLPALSGLVISGGVVDAYRALTGTTGAPVSATSQGGLTPGASTPEDLEAFLLAKAGSTPDAFLQSTFQALFGRDVDGASLTYFTNALATGGTSRSAIVRALQATPEARATKVARWFQDDLGRSLPVANLKSDPGVLYWAYRLAGAPDADVRSALLADPAVYAAAGGTTASWLQLVYQAAVARDVDPGAVTYFSAQLASGTSRQAIVRALLKVEESRRTTVARMLVHEFGWTLPVTTLKNDAGVGVLAGYLASG